MKKALTVLVLLLGVCMIASAETATKSVAVTNNQAITYSDQFNIPGGAIIDKIEVVQSVSNATITVATYSGTTAIETLASLTTLATTTKLIRPVFLPTDNTGTALTASAGTGTNTLTQLVIPYEKAVGGGNIKMAVTAGAMDAGSTNTVSATIFYHKASGF